MTEHGLPRRRKEGCLSDARLDALTHDELSVSEANEVNGHLESCASCRERCNEMTTARDAWRARSLPALSSLAAMSPAPVPEEMRAKVLPFRRPSTWAGGAAAVLAAAASLLVVVRGSDPREDDRTLRTKGELALRVFVEGPQNSRELVVGDALYTGDRLRFALPGAGDGLALIVGVDGAGEASVYAPSSGQFASVGVDGALEGIAQLDAVVGPERLIAVVCTGAPALSVVLDAARQREESSWPEGCRVVERRFDKRLRP